MSLKSNILKIDPKYWHVEFGSPVALRYGISVPISGDFEFSINDGYIGIVFYLNDDFIFLNTNEILLVEGINTPIEGAKYLSIVVAHADLGVINIHDLLSASPQVLVDADPVVMNRLLLNKEDFECIAQVAKHCDWEQLCLYIREQQNLTLLPLVGDCIFNLLMQDENEWSDEIKNLWHGSTFEGCGGENKTHFGLKMSLIHWAYGAYVYRHSAVDTPFGVVQKVGRESVPVEISQLRAINKEQRENADFYFERTKEYLCKIKDIVGCGGCDCICNYCSNNGRKVQNRGFKFRLVSKKI